MGNEPWRSSFRVSWILQHLTQASLQMTTWYRSHPLVHVGHHHSRVHRCTSPLPGQDRSVQSWNLLSRPWRWESPAARSRRSANVSHNMQHTWTRIHALCENVWKLMSQLQVRPFWTNAMKACEGIQGVWVNMTVNGAAMHIFDDICLWLRDWLTDRINIITRYYAMVTWKTIKTSSSTSVYVIVCVGMCGDRKVCHRI